jgi:hypothetical protein
MPKRPISFVLNQEGFNLSPLKGPQPVVEEEDDDDNVDYVDVEEEERPTKQQKVPTQDSFVEDLLNEALGKNTTNTNNPFTQSTPIPDVTPSGDPYLNIKLRMSVETCKKWFPEKLQEFDTSNLQSMSDSQLKEMLENMRFKLGAANAVEFYLVLMTLGVQIVEVVGSVVGWKLCGLARAVEDDPEMSSLLKEIVLQNLENGWGMVDPYQRLCMMMLGKMYQLHISNSSQETVENLRKVIVSQADIDQFKDL